MVLELELMNGDFEKKKNMIIDNMWNCGWVISSGRIDGGACQFGHGLQIIL